MDTATIFNTIKDHFREYKNVENVEMEMRLGKFNGTFFDTNIGKEKYDFLMRALQKYDGWEKIINTNTEVFYRSNDGMRMSVDEDTGEEKIIIKKNIKNFDFTSDPYDVRFSTSYETPVEVCDREMDKRKTKNRVSFIRKNLSIDMTVVSGDGEDMDSEEVNTYQVEFEIIDPKKIGDDTTLFNAIHKVKDLLKVFGQHS